MQTRGEMYKAVANLVLIYGSERCVVTGYMLKVLTVFHHRAAQRITGMTAKCGTGGEWDYPVVEEAMESAGIHPNELYSKGRKTTISEMVACQTIYSLYTEA